jgi:hypothetical protein
MSQTLISGANSVIGNDDDDVSMYGGIQALSSKFEKIVFDGKDYPTWKFRFTSMLLVGLGLLGIVDGTADDKARGYKSRRDYVFSMLVMSMTDATIKFAKGAKAGYANSLGQFIG